MFRVVVSEMTYTVLSNLRVTLNSTTIPYHCIERIRKAFEQLKSRLLRSVLIDGTHPVSCYSSVGTMSLSCTASKILSFVYALWAYVTSSNLEQNCRLIIQTFAKTYLPIIFNGLVSDIRPTFFWHNCSGELLGFWVLKWPFRVTRSSEITQA